jgi:hypothetical protein
MDRSQRWFGALTWSFIDEMSAQVPPRRARKSGSFLTHRASQPQLNSRLSASALLNRIRRRLLSQVRPALGIRDHG